MYIHKGTVIRPLTPTDNTDRPNTLFPATPAEFMNRRATLARNAQRLLPGLTNPTKTDKTLFLCRSHQQGTL